MALVVLAASVVGAVAASEKPVFAGCIEDEDRDLEGMACADAPGLAGATSVAVSRDGRSVYVGTYDSLVRFSRDPATGALAFAECLEDGDVDRMGERCTNVAGNFTGALSIALSPDDRSLYSAYGDIASFDRDPRTGNLSFAGCIEDEDTDRAGAECADAPGLAGASSVTVSPDGRSVYAAAAKGNAIVGLRRNPSTGRLGFVNCIEREQDDRERGKCANAPGLGGVGEGSGSVAVSGDGRSVYAAASANSSLIAHFDRKQKTGAIDFAGCIEEEQTGRKGARCADAPGLLFATSVAASPDGKSIYTGSEVALVQFDRKRKTGALTFASCFDDEDSGWTPKCEDIPGLELVTGVTVSPDGRSLLATTYFDSSMVRFERRRTGDIRFAACVEDEDRDKERRKCANAPGLRIASAVAASADGKSNYVVSGGDGAVVRFRPPSG